VGVVRVTRAPGLTVHAIGPHSEAVWEVRHEASGQPVVKGCRTLKEAIEAARKLAEGLDWLRPADELVEDTAARDRMLAVQMWVHIDPKRRDKEQAS
jgi:hypothetical protein